MLCATGLTKRFGNLLAVEDVSISVRPGCVTGMLGPNGAGKTTTLRMICGVLQSDAGSVTINGVDLAADPSRAKTALGWLPDAAPAYGELSVDAWLQLRCRLMGVATTRLDQVVEQCDLGDVRRRLVGRLSRGFRQRVALAAALVHDPDLLVLDEPSTGLDPVQQRSFRELVRRLAQDRALLLSTHQLADAQRMCDELVLINAGRVIGQGSVADMRQAAGGGALTLETKGDPTEALRVVASVKACVCTPLADGWMRTAVTVADDQDDCRADVAAAVTAAGLIWRELTTDHGALGTLIERRLEGDEA